MVRGIADLLVHAIADPSCWVPLVRGGPLPPPAPRMACGGCQDQLPAWQLRRAPPGIGVRAGTLLCDGCCTRHIEAAPTRPPRRKPATASARAAPCAPCVWPSAGLVEQVTPRQREVLALAGMGITSRSGLARAMGLTGDGVKWLLHVVQRTPRVRTTTRPSVPWTSAGSSFGMAWKTARWTPKMAAA
jgi:hypothetical protein